MKSLLLSFPEFLISASDKAANKLGVSRSEFIRQSVIHELNHLSKRTMENNIISSYLCKKIIIKENPFGKIFIHK